MITVLGADLARQYIRPSPYYGVNQLVYNGETLYCTPMDTPESVNPASVAIILEDLQRAVPLGSLDGHVFLCIDQNLQGLDTDHKPMEWYNGVRMDGWTALTGKPTRTLNDLLAHELGHSLAERFMGYVEQTRFFEITGLPWNVAAQVEWHERPAELITEYLTAALWDMPIDARMVAQFGTPSAGTLANLREWALNLIGDWPRAQVVTQNREVKLTIGSTAATINGEAKTLDVAPVLRSGRTCIPLRAVGEALGAAVHWSTATQRAYVILDGVEVMVQPGSTLASVNDRWTTLDVAPWIENGRVLVPMRFVAECLAFSVNWDQTTQTVTITK